MLGRLCDLDSWPHPWSWPWNFKDILWNGSRYLRNVRADWNETMGMWVDKILDQPCDLELWPRPWLWPWFFFVFLIYMHKNTSDTTSVHEKMFVLYIDGLVQDCSNSMANTLELLHSCTKPSVPCCCDHATILHMPRQLSCRGMCKTVWHGRTTKFLGKKNFIGKNNFHHHHHGCWCPGSLCHQGISTHDIDYVD